MSVFSVIFVLGLNLFLVSTLSSDEVHPLDLGVMIDGSMNAGQDNFNKELEFVRKLFNRFPISEHGVHVGLGVVSDDGLIAFNFVQHMDNSSVNEAIGKLTYPGGASNVGKALLKVRGWIFQNSERKEAPKVLVTLFKGTTSDDIKGPSAQLQEDGVRIVSIGVEADRIQVNTISSIVMLESMMESLYETDKKLNNIVKAINEAVGVHSDVVTDDLDEVNEGRISVSHSEGHYDAIIGGVTKNEETSRPLEPVDIAFLIDGSEGVGKDDFERELKFVGQIANKFPISEVLTRFALGTISDDGRIDFDFSQKQDKQTIAKSIRLVAYPAGKMNAGKALAKVKEEIFGKYTRSGTAQVLIIIMKNKSLDDVKSITADIRENRIKIIAIGISKLRKDIDTSSSITIFKDDVNELLSDKTSQRYLFQKIKEQAENQT